MEKTIEFLGEMFNEHNSPADSPAGESASLTFQPEADPPQAEREGEDNNIPPLKIRGG